jgi:hypothetical protein
MHVEQIVERFCRPHTAEFLTRLPPKQIHYVALKLGGLRRGWRLGQRVGRATVLFGDEVAVHVEGESSRGSE